MSTNYSNNESNYNSNIALACEEAEPMNVFLLTDVVSVLLHNVRLEQVVSQDEGALLHRVQQHGSGPQLLACAQLPPRRLGLRLQQIVDRLHHGLGSPNHRFSEKKLSWPGTAAV